MAAYAALRGTHGITGNVAAGQAEKSRKAVLQVCISLRWALRDAALDRVWEALHPVMPTHSFSNILIILIII